MHSEAITGKREERQVKLSSMSSLAWGLGLGKYRSLPGRLTSRRLFWPFVSGLVKPVPGAEPAGCPRILRATHRQGQLILFKSDN